MPNRNKEMDDSSKPSTDGGRDSQNTDYKDNATNLQQLFSFLFFGLLTQFDDRYNVNGSSTTTETKTKTNAITNESSNFISLDQGDSNEETSSLNEHTIDGVLDQIEKLIPHDPIAVRQSTLYKSTLQLLQWQRDNYLVGGEYAEWRKNDRLRQQKQQPYFQANSVTNYNIPYNHETFCHHHIASLAGNFIPSTLVRNLLTPIVTGLFVKDTGVLFDPIKQSTINLILDQQKLLEGTMKNQLLHLLDNPRNRDAIKDSTQGIIIQTAKIDDAGHSEAK
jgi:hypothetical protein